MIKTLFIIFTIFTSNLTLATYQTNSAKKIADIISPPGSAALNIMLGTLDSLRELRRQNKASEKNVEALIRMKLLPNLAMGVATEIALEDHWHILNTKQKNFFQNYISESLIQDYISILSSYENMNSVKISVEPNIRRKANKAIVKLKISLNNVSKPFYVTLKMIRLNTWNVYDVVFSGVSIVKNYQEQFNSYIKRKGIEALIKRFERKLKRQQNK
jgi:phospholipid transport system substrate-binding protein